MGFIGLTDRSWITRVRPITRLRPITYCMRTSSPDGLLGLDPSTWALVEHPVRGFHHIILDSHDFKSN